MLSYFLLFLLVFDLNIYGPIGSSIITLVLSGFFIFFKKNINLEIMGQLKYFILFYFIWLCTF